MIVLRYIILAPILGVILNTFVGRYYGKKVVAAVACGSVFVSFLISLNNFIYMQVRLTIPEMKPMVDSVFSWIAVGRVQVPIELVFDPLSAVMCLIVTGVGFLIHVYSVGYMAHDPGFRRFFIYLNLFISFMLILVLGDNLALMFVGWEGVGLCSYLLIGFWHTDMKNASAGKKAFVVNRIGDFGFLLAMLLLLAAFDTLSMTGIGRICDDTVSSGIAPVTAGMATLICLLLFLGATGKSAQIPLYVWLPDAMAGPTPVSALIHAATMVTAGVYMIARLHFLFALSPVASGVVAAVGAATALYAAVIGLAQNDIKKVLAYSTVSQLGYMFLAVGVGAYTFGIFHLTTHAFFKALLFLGSGSVIHAMSGEQDMRRMGGLRRLMPATYWTFLAGTLALAGIYPLSGFFSKDEILLSAYLSSTPGPGGMALFAAGLAAAFLTAFYMGRLFTMTFLGECRADAKTQSHIHESPWSMCLPLIILAVLSAAAGFGIHAFEHTLAPLFGMPEEAPVGAKYWVIALSLTAGCSGLAISIWMYLLHPSWPEKIAQTFSGAHRWVENKFYIDELYEMTAVKIVYVAGVVSHAFDKHVVDRMVNWTGSGLKLAGLALSFFQSGNVGTYAVWFLVGVFILLHAMGGPRIGLGSP